MSRLPHTLVVHVGGIGDFLLSCPALAGLAEEGPVTLLGHQGRLNLAVAGGIAEQAVSTAAVDFSSAFNEPSRRLAEWLARFDRAVVWIGDDGTLEEAFHRCGVREVRCFPGLPPQDWPRHASEYYLHCLGLGERAVLRLSLPPAEAKQDVVIHPGSGGAKKNWPLERFEAVAAILKIQGRAVHWCLGPAEAEAGIVVPGPVLEAGSLVELGQALAAARLYIGNDSGITHLAAAVGCPTLAVFGPTDPAVWAPRGEHVWVYRDSWEYGARMRSQE